VTVIAHTRRRYTDKGRLIITDLETVDEVVAFWRDLYDRIFAGEAKARRAWGSLRKPYPGADVIDAEIQARQVQWDAYVTEQLLDLLTLKQR
jgi:hypothetical protein